MRRAWFPHPSLSGTNATHHRQSQTITNAANSPPTPGPRTHIDLVWLFSFRNSMPFNLLRSWLFPAQKSYDLPAPAPRPLARKESSLSLEYQRSPHSPKVQGVAFSCFSFIPSLRSSCSHFLFGKNRMSFISFSWLTPRDELILKRLHQEPKQLSNNSRQT